MVKTHFTSDLLPGKTFETEEKCLAAEAEFKKAHEAEQKKKEERAARAKEVEQLFKQATEANNKARKALQEFNEDYGVFHTSFTSENVPTTLWDIFDDFLRF